MAIPKKQYMKLTDGDDGTASDIYKDGVRVQNRIKIGDTLKISGTASNNGIFSVSSIVVEGTDVYYVMHYQ